MSLVHLTDTLMTVETTNDPRTDKRAFDYGYALNYARRALRADELPDWQNVAEDIAQSAFLRYWRSRRKGTPLDTRGAVRFATRAYRRAERKSQPIRKRCVGCVRESEPCNGCQIRLSKDAARWAVANRPTGTTSAIRDTLAEVASRPDDTTATDVTLPLDGTKTRQHLQTLIRWIAAGSSLKDVADHLGVSAPYVQKLLAVLRSTTDPADYITTSGPVEPQSDRTYGQGQGTTSMWVGPMADLLDTEFGHNASDYVPTNVLPAPTGKPIPPVDETAYPARLTSDPFNVGPEFAFAYGDVFGEDALLHTW